MTRLGLHIKINQKFINNEKEYHLTPMDFNNYQALAKQTAIYPNPGKNLVYTALGLSEEIGETLQKIDEKDIPGVLKELGDVTWYIACCATECQAALEDVVNQNRVLLMTKPVRDLMMDLYIQSSVISGRAKKVLRDNGGVIPEDKKQVILKALAECLGLVNLVAQSYNSSLEEVANLNIKKLQERLNKGTLKGDGDNR